MDVITVGPQTNRLDLFGASRRWKAEEWTSQDDSIRGGKSVSYLLPNVNGTVAIFQGAIDPDALGGAGFASQRTIDDDTVWDLNEYDGVEIVVNTGNYPQKTFTIVLKNDIPGKDTHEKDRSTISYEYSFQPLPNHPQDGEKFIVKWEDFRPMYRGREKKGAAKLDVGMIRRWSLMARSFFGKQNGPFQITVVSIAAVKLLKGRDANMGLPTEIVAKVDIGDAEKMGRYHDEYDEFDDDFEHDNGEIYNKGSGGFVGSLCGGVCTMQ
ncbi:hypothetical protein RUND412_003682 [Rhizina undulata]